MVSVGTTHSFASAFHHFLWLPVHLGYQLHFRILSGGFLYFFFPSLFILGTVGMVQMH